MSVPPATKNATAAKPRPFDLPVLVAVWLSFFVYGAIAAPVPAVNEPHYLCKAKHFWQPDWCANDFFLQSSNAHTVFFATIGSLTQWLSLDQTAWVGRVLAMLVLSMGWCSLIATLANCRWIALHVCWLFLALESCGNFSGEWLVGGVEGKVFSYGLLFAALGQLSCGRLFAAGALAGMAIAMHPVVGVWGVLAFAGATVWGYWRGSEGRTRLLPSRDEGQTPNCIRGSAGALPSQLSLADQDQSQPVTGPLASFPCLLTAFAAMVICALPGLIPVILLLSEPVSAETKFAANYIQVYYRLAHHLDPMQFPARAYLGYAILATIWVVLMAATQRDNTRRVLDRIVGFSILFALAGVIIGWGPRPAAQMPYFAERAQLLKFYPFRLADVLVPLGVSIGAVCWMPSRGPRSVRIIAYGLVFVAALFRAQSIREVNRYSGELRADWIDACHWIDEHLPANAVVQAPHNGWAFKWFAGRAEYVTFKDCPQDAAGIVEWNRRLNFLKRWYEHHYADRFYSADELRKLRSETAITHLLTDRLGPLALEPVYRNATFQVYDLTSLD